MASQNPSVRRLSRSALCYTALQTATEHVPENDNINDDGGGISYEQHDPISTYIATARADDVRALSAHR